MCACASPCAQYPSVILIAGCGYVGSALANLLLQDGHEVWGLRRETSRLRRGVRPWAADLADAGALAPPAAFDAVVYAVGADARTETAYRQAYVFGTQRLVAGLRAQSSPPKRVVFVSSTGVYSQQGGAWVDEASPTTPHVFSGRLLLEGEIAAQEGPWETVVLRLAGIYGPGRTHLVDTVQRGEAYCIEGRTAVLNHLHRDDCAGVIRHLLQLPAPEPLYIGVDCEPADKCRVLHWLAARLGVAPPRIIPASEAPSETRGGFRYCSNKRLIQSGYIFTYPSYREGYEAVMRHA